MEIDDPIALMVSDDVVTGATLIVVVVGAFASETTLMVVVLAGGAMTVEAADVRRTVPFDAVELSLVTFEAELVEDILRTPLGVLV